MTEPNSYFGKYKILRTLGGGGMGEVLLCEQQWEGGIKRKVAVKRIRQVFTRTEQFKQFFLREARIISSLHHPGIVQFYDFGEIDEIYYMAMEYIEGASLGDLIKASRTHHLHIPVDLALSIIIAVGSGLEYLHSIQLEEGRISCIIHRDVNPQNILISQQGDVKLVDFGIAKDIASQSNLTKDGIKGKLHYMSPEQLTEPFNLDCRTDIFSLSLTLYELLTNYLPYAHYPNDLDTMRAVMDAKIPPVREFNPEISAALERVVAKGLASDRDKRYQEIKELGNALKNVLRTEYSDPSRSKLTTLLDHMREIVKLPPTVVPSRPPRSSAEIPASPENRRFSRAAEVTPAQLENVAGSVDNVVPAPPKSPPEAAAAQDFWSELEWDLAEQETVDARTIPAAQAKAQREAPKSPAPAAAPRSFRLQELVDDDESFEDQQKTPDIPLQNDFAWWEKLILFLARRPDQYSVFIGFLILALIISIIFTQCIVK
jgi:serine/threonine-protein kinase